MDGPGKPASAPPPRTAAYRMIYAVFRIGYRSMAHTLL